MAGNKTFDLTRDGKVFKLRIAAGDMTVSRLSRAFQAIVSTFGVLQNRPIFRFGTFVFFMIKCNENKKLTLIFKF